MFIGGYQIVDFKDVALSTTATTIAGAYRALTKNRKLKIASGLNFNSKKHDDLPTGVITASSGYVTFVCDGYTIKVTTADAVTATVIA